MHGRGGVSRNLRSPMRTLKRGPARKPEAGATAGSTERRINQSDKDRNALENLIAEGALAPGSRLDEETLSTQFGLSRTPVREALLQLASTGLVESRPRQSATVATLSVSAIIESFEFNV